MNRTLGIEEEFLLVDPETGELVGRAVQVLDGAHRLAGEQVTSELNRCQVESNTVICTDLDDATADLTRMRGSLAQAGAAVGAVPVPLGTHPWSAWDDQQVNTDKEHYRTLVDMYQHVARQQVICGCHIHVGVDDPDARIIVMNGVRRWLPALLALSANSPWWQGADTGYASYRTILWRGWPTAAVPPRLRDYAEYDRLVEGLRVVGVIDEPSALYWYVRPSAQLPTVEFRPCDVCLRVDDAVTIAGLVRALTSTVLTQEGDHEGSAPPGILEAGIWRAARFGLDGSLIDPTAFTLTAAPVVVAQLVDFVADELRASGDYDRVTSGIDDILGRGNGATAQRRALSRYSERPQALEALQAMPALVETTPSGR